MTRKANGLPSVICLQAIPISLVLIQIETLSVIGNLMKHTFIAGMSYTLEGGMQKNHNSKSVYARGIFLYYDYYKNTDRSISKHPESDVAMLPSG